MTILEKKLKLPTITLSYLVMNQGAGQRVFTFHGWMDNAASFIPLAREMPELEFLSFDLPGHGKSQHLSRQQFYHFIDGIKTIYEILQYFISEDLNNSIPEKPVPGVDVVAHSMGAGLSVLAAAIFPEIFRSLIAIESLGPLSYSDPLTADKVRESFLQLIRLDQREKKSSVATLEQAIALRQRAGELSYESAKLLMQRGSYKRGGRYYWRRDERLRLRSVMRFSEEQVSAYMQAICCHLLYIEADRGYPYDKQQIKKRLEQIKNSTRVQLSGHHHLHMDAPAAVAAAIRDYRSGWL